MLVVHLLSSVEALRRNLRPLRVQGPTKCDYLQPPTLHTLLSPSHSINGDNAEIHRATMRGWAFDHTRLEV